MNKRKGFLDVLCLLLLLIIVFVICYTFSKFLLPTDSKGEITSLKNQLEEWKSENTKLKEEKKEADIHSKEKINNSNQVILELEKKLSASNKEIKELSKQHSIEEKNSYEFAMIVLSLLFPKMEFDYEIRDSTMKFYSDPSCKEDFLITGNLVWTGYTDYNYPYNDNTYYVSAIVDKDSKYGFSLVFSKRQPILYAIK